MNIGSYYEPAGESRYKPTTHAGGAWDPEEQHFSPLGGLVVHAIDRYVAGRGGSGLVLSRISFDILGRLALDECEIGWRRCGRGGRSSWSRPSCSSGIARWCGRGPGC